MDSFKRPRTTTSLFAYTDDANRDHDTGPEEEEDFDENEDEDYDMGSSISADDEGELELGDSKRRMQIIRSLQASFYKSSSTKKQTIIPSFTDVAAAAASASSLESEQQQECYIDYRTGLLHNLPLWRVGWTEVPGRTNVLSVHEPMYTNMFERMIRSSPQPWYVGHLFLPGGSKNFKSTKAAHGLETWEQRVERLEKNAETAATVDSENDDDDSPSAQSAVLGTLLRVVDYRRMVDGKLLLLVQAMERFVVTQVLQTLPYSVATVQLLPDTEEVDDDPTWWSNPNRNDNESVIAAARGLAVMESFERWHRYEYENTVLPLPSSSSQDLEPEQVWGSAIAKVLPFAPYSSTVNVTELRAEVLPTITDTQNGYGYEVEWDDVLERKKNVANDSNNSSSLSSLTLEYRLVQGGIFKPVMLLDRSLMDLSTDELEYRLWIQMNYYLKKSRAAVSPILFGLLPPASHMIRPWPSCNISTDSSSSRADSLESSTNSSSIATKQGDALSDTQENWGGSFVLEKIANAIAKQTQLDHKYVRLSEDYPSLRRQKRLSYAAASLLEKNFDFANVHQFRHELLQIPSTKARMAFLLQLFTDVTGLTISTKTTQARDKSLRDDFDKQGFSRAKRENNPGCQIDEDENAFQ